MQKANWQKVSIPNQIQDTDNPNRKRPYKKPDKWCQFGADLWEHLIIGTYDC